MYRAKIAELKSKLTPMLHEPVNIKRSGYCRHCNQTKSGRTPEQARMELVYAPYVPNKAEYLILCNRNILADQMDFLARHVPSQSRVRAA